MNLPPSLSEALAPLFEKLPLDAAMPQLLPTQPASSELLGIVKDLVVTSAVSQNPTLAAGLWLYVDDLSRSHEISQQIPGAEGSLWHGIMHPREGDFWNSKYWLQHAGKTSALSTVQAVSFVDRVQKASPANPPELLEEQREEWAQLFEWCAKEKAL